MKLPARPPLVAPGEVAVVVVGSDLLEDLRVRAGVGKLAVRVCDELAGTTSSVLPLTVGGAA